MENTSETIVNEVKAINIGLIRLRKDRPGLYVKRSEPDSNSSPADWILSQSEAQSLLDKIQRALASPSLEIQSIPEEVRTSVLREIQQRLLGQSVPLGTNRLDAYKPK